MTGQFVEATGWGCPGQALRYHSLGRRSKLFEPASPGNRAVKPLADGTFELDV